MPKYQSLLKPGEQALPTQNISFAAPQKQQLYIPSMLQSMLNQFQGGAKSQAESLVQNKTVQQGLEASKAIGQQVAKPILSTVQKSVNPVVNTLTAPGSTYVTPTLEKFGVSPAIAVGAGIAADIAAPGPGGEFKGVSKGLKAVKDAVKNLLVVHNLSEQKLRFADRIGGLVNPSMAVIDPKLTSFEGYGDISLIAPKSLIQGQKTHLADAYSPRFPSIHSTMKWEDFKKLESDLEPFYKKIGENVRKIYHDDSSMIREIENSPAVALKFLEEKGLKPTKEGASYYISQIQKKGLDGEYQKFLDGLYKKYNLDEKLFAGYTNGGQRRYRPLNIGEASKIMSKEKEEGFNYGLGSYRSKVAPIMKSPDQIRKERYRLVDRPSFEKIKEEYETELYALKDELAPFAKNLDSNQFIESDSQLDAIGGVLSGEKDAMQYFRAKFGEEVPDELIQKVYEFRNKLKTMPTEYFETKFKRPVGLEEFKVAVVPNTLAPEAVKLLQDKGLQVVKYAKGKKQEVMKKLLENPEAAFGLVPFALPPTQVDNKNQQR